MVPPPYLGKTFAGDHTHYLTTGYDVLDPPDVEGLLYHVKEHGYGLHPPAVTIVILINPVDFDAAGMSSWRAGVEVRTNVKAKWDFIPPSALMPAWISDETIHGPVPPNSEYNGLQVWFVRRGSRHPIELRAARLRRGRGDRRTEQRRQPSRVPRARQPGLPRATPYPGQRPLPNPRFVLRQGGFWRRHAPSRRGSVAQITTNTLYTPPTTIET